MRRRDRAWKSGDVDVGVDSFAAVVTDPDTGAVVESAERMAHLLEEIELADRVGLDSFGIGEHHRVEYYDSAPAVILAAAAARTSRIRLGSAVTVLCAADPVRVFQQFATLDLISGGPHRPRRRPRLVHRGVPAVRPRPRRLRRALRREARPAAAHPGGHRGHLVGAAPAASGAAAASTRARVQDPLPIWVGVGGTPESFVRAGLLGLPLMVAIIGGEPRQFAPLVDLYRRAGAEAGHPPETLQRRAARVRLRRRDVEQATSAFYPGWAAMFTKVSRERGFPPPTRRQFDATRGPDGAFFVGDPETVAAKCLRVSEQLGGVDRINLQMTNPRLRHADLLRGIELLGTEVVPLVKS